MQTMNKVPAAAIGERNVCSYLLVSIGRTAKYGHSSSAHNAAMFSKLFECWRQPIGIVCERNGYVQVEQDLIVQSKLHFGRPIRDWMVVIIRKEQCCKKFDVMLTSRVSCTHCSFPPS